MPEFDSCYLSDVGLKRTNNEDAAGKHEPADARQLKQSGCLYVVADGLGGHQMGEKASNYAVETLLKVYFEAPTIAPEKRLRDIILQINQSLFSFARKNFAEGEKTATTVVAAVVRNNTLLVANVGDSRAYLIRDGKIRQITNDHSFVGELVRVGTISEVEAQQSKFKNRLSRSVGGDSKLEVELYPPIPLLPGDMILLCTDGLTQYATAQDLLEAASGGKVKEIVERLIQFAKAKGGSDNITASVIKIGEKSTWMQNKKSKTITAIILGMATLAAFSLLGWFWFTGQPTFFKATSTSTLFPTLTATSLPTFTSTPIPMLTPTQTANLILEQPQTATATSSGTPSASPAAVNLLVNCDYVVKAGDTAGNLAAIFQTTIEQIFRQDGTQQDMNRIDKGENLIIKNISPEACANGGGVVSIQAPATIP